MSLKIGVLADLHIGRGGNKPYGVKQYLSTLREAIAGMEREGVEICVFAGDTLDKSSSFNSFVIFELQRIFSNSKMTFIILEGNDSHDHDNEYREYPTILPLAAKNVSVIGFPECISYGDGEDRVNLIFIPWLKRDNNRAAVMENFKKDILKHLEKNPYPSFCFFHAAIEGAKFYGEESKDFTLSPAELLELNCEVYAGGHYHGRQQIADKIWYVGAMERNTFGERQNPCGWMLIEQGKEPRFIELDNAANWMQIPFDTDSSYEDLIYPLGESDTKISGHVKLTFTARRENMPDMARVEAAYRTAGAQTFSYDVKYLDAESVRVEGMTSEKGDMELFTGWAGAAPENDPDGKLAEILAFEMREGYPVTVAGTDKAHFDKFMRGGE